MCHFRCTCGSKAPSIPSSDCGRCRVGITAPAGTSAAWLRPRPSSRSSTSGGTMTPNTPAARTFHTGYGRRVGAAQHTAPARVSRRVMPHSIDAEESVLGASYFRRSHRPSRRLCRAGRLLRHTAPSDLHGDALAVRAVAPHRHHHGCRGDEAAGDDPTLSASGSEAYLAELANKIASTDNIALHARIVRDRATARKLILVGSDIVDRGYGGQLNVEEYLEEAQRAVLRSRCASAATATRTSSRYFIGPSSA